MSNNPDAQQIERLLQSIEAQNRTLEALVSTLSQQVATHTVPESEYLDVPAAAVFLGIAEPTLRSWIHKRRLPVFRIGRRVQLRRADLEKFRMDSRRRPATELEAIARRGRAK